VIIPKMIIPALYHFDISPIDFSYDTNSL